MFAFCVHLGGPLSFEMPQRHRFSLISKSCISVQHHSTGKTFPAIVFVDAIYTVLLMYYHLICKDLFVTYTLVSFLYISLKESTENGQNVAELNEKLQHKTPV